MQPSTTLRDNMLNIISAEGARQPHPIREYNSFCKTLEAELWRTIYSKQNIIDLHFVGSKLRLDNLDDRPWFQVLLQELEALGYSVSADGVMSW